MFLSSSDVSAKNEGTVGHSTDVGLITFPVIRRGSVNRNWRFFHWMYCR